MITTNNLWQITINGTPDIVTYAFTYDEADRIGRMSGKKYEVLEVDTAEILVPEDDYAYIKGES